MKRVVARGIILKNSKLVTIHRIKEKDGRREEYYVLPGGGTEGEETLEATVKREVKEEVGIDVNVIRLLYKFECERDIEYFFLCEYVGGVIGTGVGPEFTSKAYKDKGLYIAELVELDKVLVKLLPQVVSDAMRIDLMRFGSLYEVPKRNSPQWGCS